ncbi:hypothetical protein GGI42DRAFT_197169 [Trichoderma sp. SZMC 28013]
MRNDSMPNDILAVCVLRSKKEKKTKLTDWLTVIKAFCLRSNHAFFLLLAASFSLFAFVCLLWFLRYRRASTCRPIGYRGDCKKRECRMFSLSLSCPFFFFLRCWGVVPSQK